MFQSSLPSNQRSLNRRNGPSHRKRFSVSRLSSDTTATLPEYTSPPTQIPAVVWSDTFLPVPSEEPPDYPDSANEADEETEDDVAPLSPLISPRRHRRSQSLNKIVKGSPHFPSASASDTYLDSLLERSVNALELSNNLLQSSISTHTSLSNMFETDSTVDNILESRTKVLSSRIRENRDTHKVWMNDLDEVTEGLEHILGEDKQHDKGISRSLPTYGYSMPHPKFFRSSGFSRRTNSYQTSAMKSCDSLSSQNFSCALNRRIRSHDSNENQSNLVANMQAPCPSFKNSLRSGQHNSDDEENDRYATHSLSSNYDRKRPRKGKVSRSSSASSTIKSKPRSSSMQRSRSRSSSQTRSRAQPPSQLALPYQLPPTIAELPSHSESSNSSSSEQLFRTTVESLKKILHDQPVPSGSDKNLRSPTFQPRSPPVTPVISTFSTTTSISRLLTKGSHTTSTRPPSPPKQSSLRRKTPSSLSIVDMSLPQSTFSSGRSTPRQVAFGPLPESYSSLREGSSLKLKDKRRLKRDKHDKKDEDGESSWWRIWLTGGSGLSMSAERQEERVEERAARSWGRPGMGAGLEDWAM